ncbi:MULTISPECIES: hypothetical protein [Anoxynatronum]|uniref:Uncharacterized protein n=2 Tax=Anoxynatronum TaxID=210622 RepID=A0AA45WV67_9CLOT|nr:hypothetical protein [Anoxynatronum buryatiense]SMP51398.1 hypothetical protein SAMN06296020_10495 [Anoxynatronum buryatiense]
MRMTDLLVPLLFLFGFGFMAWRLMKGKKDRDQQLTQLAAARGWHFYPGKGGGVVDHQHPEERNRLFTLEGVTAAGTSWRLESRGKMELKGQRTLPAYTRLVLEQFSEVPVMMIPDPGSELPAGMMSRLLENYGVHPEEGVLKPAAWPKGMEPRYRLYAKAPERLAPLLEIVAQALPVWAGKLPAARQPVFLGGDETGLFLNWGIEKPEDVAALVTLAENWSEVLARLTASDEAPAGAEDEGNKNKAMHGV